MNRQEALDQLCEGITQLTSSDQWQRWLLASASFISIRSATSCSSRCSGRMPPQWPAFSSRGGRPVTYDRSAYRGTLVLVAALLWINDFKASPAPGSTAARPLRAAQLHPGSAGRRTSAGTLD